MTNITIGTSEIRCIDGLFSLNDLHKASGNLPKHQPSFFLRNEQTKSLVQELSSANSQTLKTIVGKGRRIISTHCRALSRWQAASVCLG